MSKKIFLPSNHPHPQSRSVSPQNPGFLLLAPAVTDPSVLYDLSGPWLGANKGRAVDRRPRLVMISADQDVSAIAEEGPGAPVYVLCQSVREARDPHPLASPRTPRPPSRVTWVLIMSHDFDSADSVFEVTCAAGCPDDGWGLRCWIFFFFTHFPDDGSDQAL